MRRAKPLTVDVSRFEEASQLPFGLIAKCDMDLLTIARREGVTMSQLPFGLIAKCDGKT